MNNRPIGVFDSGIGGLTVLKEILSALPGEGTIYLGDTARVPYGIRSAETVIRYAFENTGFLFGQDIKLLVIACNTASAVGLEAVQKKLTIPVIGVIEPGAKAAVRETKNKRIGIIGTEATVMSGAYTRAIMSLDKSVSVSTLPCPLFVPLAEEGFTDDEIVTKVAERYLKPIKNKGIDTLVLGCTHYPLLKGVISAIMGNDVMLIDSAVETAKEISKILITRDIQGSHVQPARIFYVTDSPERFVKVGERFLGQKIDHIEKVQVGF